MVLPFQYWPSIEWMQQFARADEIWLEQCGNYQKQSLINRCKITGANGPITLSVPLIGGREQKALLKDVEIDNTQRWAVQHLRTIKSCYSKAPFFEHYFPQVELLLLQQHERVIELDYLLIVQLQKWLKCTPHILLTQQFQGIDLHEAGTISPLITKTYIQVFAHKYPFIPGLSVLDVLFCLGPQTLNYLST